MPTIEVPARPGTVVTLSFETISGLACSVSLDLHGTLRDRLSVNGQVAVALTHISVTVTRCGPAIQGGKAANRDEPGTRERRLGLFA